MIDGIDCVLDRRCLLDCYAEAEDKYGLGGKAVKKLQSFTE